MLLGKLLSIALLEVGKTYARGLYSEVWRRGKEKLLFFFFFDILLDTFSTSAVMETINTFLFIGNSCVLYKQRLKTNLIIIYITT